ncbi:MAG TPA: hypothetical protein PKJ63_02260 [Cyclobacteriaceae bacterium]|nr:hypothetical protein [Cyclobacteriaceae bacterium]
MQKLVSILLTIVVAVGSLTDLHDLVKVPYLLQHYNQHKSKDSKFSASEFFDLHYGTLAEEHDKEEHEQHKGLPFKAPDHTSIHSTIFLTERQNPAIELDETAVSYTNFYHPIFSSEFHQSIFQPPRKG